MDEQLIAGSPVLLTVTEVAARYRVSKMTVYRLIEHGELPAARIGRSLRIPEQAVRAYLDQQSPS
jgi:excisionase family DNA binding protein